MSGATATGGSSNVVREFLIKLGFKVDDGGQAKFTNTIRTSTTQAMLFASALEAAARRVYEFARAVNEGLGDLYYASQRIGASADSISHFAFGLSQIGLSAREGQDQLEKMAEFLNRNPGGESLLQRWLGHKYTIGDTLANLKAMQDVLAEMWKAGGVQRSQAIILAQQLGMSYQALANMANNLKTVREEEARSAEAAKRMGLNLQGTTADAVAFNREINFTQRLLTLLYQRITGELNVEFGPALRRFNQYLMDHAGEISRYIMDAAKYLLDLGQRINRVVQDMGGWERVIRIILELKLAAWIIGVGSNAVTLASGVLSFGAALVRLSLAVAGFNVASVTGGAAVLARLVGLFGLVGLGLFLGLDLGRTPLAGPEQDQTRWLDPDTHKYKRRKLDGTVEDDPDQTPSGGRGIPGRRPNEQRWRDPSTGKMFHFTPGGGIEEDPDQSGAGPAGGGGTGGLGGGEGYTAPTVNLADLSPEANALLGGIAEAESGGRFTALYGRNRNFTDMSQFPNRTYDTVGPDGRPTSAAGAFQFERGTWEGLRARHPDLTDFGPANQTRAAWYNAQEEYRRLTGRDLEVDVRDPSRRQAIFEALHRNQWPSNWQQGFYERLRQRGGGPAPAAGGGAPAAPAAPTWPIGPTPDTPLLPAGPLASNTPLRSPGGGGEGNTAQIAQTTHITVNGADDPVRTAELIHNRQDSVNQALVRRTRGAFA